MKLAYVGDGMILAQESSWVWFRLPIQRREMLSDEQVQLIADRETRRLGGLVGQEWHLIVAPRRYSVNKWADRLAELTPRPEEGFEGYLAEQREYLVGAGLTNREVYLGVKLKMRLISGWPGPRKLALEAKRFLPGHEAPLEVQVKEARKEAAQVWHRVRAGGSGARYASSAELRWLVARTYWRGIDEMPDQPERSAYGADLRALQEGMAVNRFQYVELGVPGAHPPRYLTSLTFSFFPNVAGSAAPWLWAYEELALPNVEVSVRGRIVPPREFRKHVDRVAAAAQDQADHIVQAGGSVPMALEETLEQTRELKYRVDKDRSPTAYVDAQVLVTAEIPDALHERVQEVKEAYGDLGIELAVPMLDQWDCFLQARPNDQPRVRGYQQKMAVEHLGESLYVASSKLGDNEGPMLGTGIGGIPVCFDIRRAVRRDKRTLVTIVGVPGSGKTTLMKWIAEQSRYMGVSVVLVDGAEECNGLANRPGIGRVNTVRIGEESAGLLDPWSIYPNDKQLGAKLAAEICKHFLPVELGERAEDLLITCADSAAEHRFRPTMGVLIRKLEEEGSEVAVRAANNLQSVSRQPMASSVFAVGDVPHLDLLNALTLLQFKGLQLPDASLQRREYDLGDRLAVGLMHAVTALAGRLIDVGTIADPKMIGYIEARTIMDSRQGLALIERDTLRGRKKNCSLILDTQGATHLNTPTLTDNISVAFVFQMGGRTESVAACHLLHIEPTDANLSAISQLGMREDEEDGEIRRYSEAIMRDLDGNVGLLWPDLQTDERRLAYLTRPPRQERVEPRTVELVRA